MLAAAVLAVPAGGTDRGITAPPGFGVPTFASGLSQPTAMAYGPDNRIYVTQTGGAIVRIRRGTRIPVVLVRGLPTPLGLAWPGRSLFVSEQGRVERFARAGRLVDRHAVVKGLPFGEHQQDNVVFHAWRLYSGSGRHVVWIQLRPNGTARRLTVFASGFAHPLALLVDRRGGLLVADWGRGIVYRIA